MFVHFQGFFGTVKDGQDSTGTYSLLQNMLGNDSGWATLVLEVVGLMCDGQHRTLQNYLRDQPDNLKVNRPKVSLRFVAIAFSRL